MRFEASSSSGYSNGVLAAKSAISSRNFCAFFALPSIVVKPIWAVWIMELKSIAVLAVASRPLFMASKMVIPTATENALLKKAPMLNPALLACASALRNPFSYSFVSRLSFAITCPIVILSHPPLSALLGPSVLRPQYVCHNHYLFLVFLKPVEQFF